ncbi:Hsp20/alpha crystallin family protein [Thermogladius sp. 4427co]|uniref:Hsp20/alpha crystallin family protein n=1 Tax=Thermogladius sp. 4427co TaxID=3450718 RepID=UPI003F78F9C8
MSDFIDEFFKRVERRLREIEDEFRREIRRIAEEVRGEHSYKPFYSETIEPLYSMRDLGDRVIVYVDLPYASEGDIEVLFEENRLRIKALLKSKIDVGKWSERYRGVEVKQYSLVIPLPFHPKKENTRIRVRKGVLEITIYK